MIAFASKPEPNRDDWWPCGCVKRTKAGKMSHIKLNSPKRKKCRVCGCTRKMIDEIAAKDAGGGA